MNRLGFVVVVAVVVAVVVVAADFFKFSIF
jgi:hypothetical protein